MMASTTPPPPPPPPPPPTTNTTTTIAPRFSAATLAGRVSALGAALAASHADKAPLVLGVLTGAFMFTADLVRAMDPPPPGLGVDFARAASYVGEASTGAVTLGGGGFPSSSAASSSSPLGTKVAITGRHVILVEDIVDTGRTLAALVSALQASGAASVTTVALLDKRCRRAPGFESVAADHVGFAIGDEFVVGYGLDVDEAWRGLPFVGVVVETDARGKERSEVG